MPNDREYKLHPEGRFPAVIVDHGFLTATTGTDQFVVKFQTEHGTITAWLAFTEAAAKHSIKKIRAMGFTGDDLSELGSGVALEGNKCEITVKHELDNSGRPRAKVDWISPEGGDKMESSAETAKAVARFNFLLRSIKAEGDDEIPF